MLLLLLSQTQHLKQQHSCVQNVLVKVFKRMHHEAVQSRSDTLLHAHVAQKNGS